MCAFWLRTWAEECLRASSGRSWRRWTFMSRQSCSSVPSVATRTQPRTAHFIVSVARGPEVSKVRSVTELCVLRVSVESYVALKCPLQCKRCQRFGHTQRNCGYAPRCVACGGVHLTGGCSTPLEQPQCCGCGGNHTASYRGCIKLKKAKAALAKRAPPQATPPLLKPSGPGPVRR